VRGEELVYKEDIQQGLQQLGIGVGGDVVVHSSLSSFGYVVGGPETVIRALMEQVTEVGTVLMPAFVQRVHGRKASYEDRVRHWNIRESPSDVGLITETFRRTHGVLRSDDPTHSFCAWGAGADAATRGHKHAWGRPSPWNERAFGKGSPWDWMYEHNAHYLLMGVDFDVCSILHYVQALYAEQEGLYEAVPPQWPGFDFSEMGSALKKRGLVDQVRVGASVWLRIRSRTLVDEALLILRRRPAMIRVQTIVPAGSE